MKTYSYPAIFEPAEQAGVYVVTFPDVPEAITQGDGMADARAMAPALATTRNPVFESSRSLPRPA